jgi:acyl-CoA synthetase (AMP-forming)/AMP-acid ligase II
VIYSEVESLWFGAALAPGPRGPRALHLLPARPGGVAERVPYDALLERARGAAAGLAASGKVRQGEPFLFVAATGMDEVLTFLGGLLLGALPIPIAPPAGLVGLESWVARIERTAAALGVTAVVGHASTLDFLGTHGVALPMLDLGAFPASGPARPGVAAGDAYVQLTSGSTADPKGVLLGHAQVAANVHMIGWSSDVQQDDRVASWLPLYHDMGLVGTLLFAIYWNLDLVLLPPQAFLTRPARWLEAISQHRCTLSPAPAFAFPYAAHRIRDAELQGLDLSSWRIAYCGAEPIHPRAVERFTQRFAPVGFSAGTIFPCYGLAETTLAVTFGPPGRGVREVAVSRRRLAQGEVAPPEGEADRLDLVKNGRTLPELALEVRDDAGRPVAPGRTGAVFVRGASVARGYYRNEDATRAVFGEDGWLDTGDLGCLVDDELVVIGRRKDLIIVRGKNHAAIDLEWAAETVDGVRPGSVAAFASVDEGEGTEVPVVCFEVGQEETAWSRGAIAAQVQEAVLAHTGLRLRDVLLLPPGTVPKTTSGKVQRSRVRSMYLEGELRA